MVQKKILYLTVNLMTANQRRDAADKPRNFHSIFDPEQIIGVIESTGELMFPMKWKYADEVDLVLAKRQI